MFGEELSTAVTTALETGYRHIDAAYFHANEETIGEVITEWIDERKVTRSDLFITSKVGIYVTQVAQETMRWCAALCCFDKEVSIYLHPYFQETCVRQSESRSFTGIKLAFRMLNYCNFFST